MQNTAYDDLKNQLKKASTLPFIENTDLRVYQSVLEHTDALIDQDSTVELIGYLFVSRLLQEGPSFGQAWSLGLQSIGEETFKWAMRHQDWSSAAWLMCIVGLNLPLSAPQHPDAKVLYALVCNDSTDWPAVYTAALADPVLIRQAMDCETRILLEDEDSLKSNNNKHYRQMRHGCYFGPGQGMMGVNTAIRWLSLHHDEPVDSGILPEKMALRHVHLEQDNLTRLLQNQWRVDQFWISGDTGYLDTIAGIGTNDFQSWYWLFSVKNHQFSYVGDRESVWDQWWLTHHFQIVEHIFFRLNLHTQVQCLDAAVLNKSERLLIVRDSLALEQRGQDAYFELPEGHLETQ